MQFVKKVKIKNNTHVKKTHPKRKSLHSNKCHTKKWGGGNPPTPPVPGTAVSTGKKQMQYAALEKCSAFRYTKQYGLAIQFRITYMNKYTV